MMTKGNIKGETLELDMPLDVAIDDTYEKEEGIIQKIQSVVAAFRARVRDIHSENKAYYTEKFEKERAEGDWFPIFNLAVMSNAFWATINDISATKAERGKDNKHFNYSQQRLKEICEKQEEE